VSASLRGLLGLRICPQQGARFALVLVVVAGFLFLQSPLAQQHSVVRRVLIFNDFGSISSPGVATLDQAIAAGLASSPYQIELYNENLEATLFPDEASQHRFREWYIRKYADRKPDVIITVGPASLRFMIESHQRSFPNIPVIFCGTTEEMTDQLKPDSHFTGVWGVAQPEKTLIAALHLQPETKHVVVVGGIGAFDRSLEALTKESLRKYESQFAFTYLTDLDMPTLLERLRRLPSKTIVYHTSMMEDAAGTHFIDAAQAVPMVANAANAPVFVMDDVDVGRGTVGGYVVSWAADGQIAAGMAVKILDGVNPEEIPVVRNNNVYLFDWRALRRWGFKESDLPPGSTLLFKQISLWERTKWIWIGGLIVILCLSTLAAYLQFSRKQLKQARDAQLLLSGLLINAQEMEQSRLASELHDDFSQRLALLALGLENASEALSDSSQATKRQMHELLTSASELGADLHTVSHRLHPSMLNTLGLAAGLRALCQEFSSGHRVEIVFSSEDIPRAVPPNVALCLFRIVQEGLQNMRKYSGVSQGHVNLRKKGDRLFLSVSDEGRGFDAKAMRNSAGLGIRSMGERARLVGGQFEIHSEPGKGTKIDVCVPLQPENLTAAELSYPWKTDVR
ncbi:MAG: ABC transporter substrate binding protein, partial [Candidatus Acidiferrales bacterium]